MVCIGEKIFALVNPLFTYGAMKNVFRVSAVIQNVIFRVGGLGGEYRIYDLVLVTTVFNGDWVVFVIRRASLTCACIRIEDVFFIISFTF